jgi:SAM-dependent methyltransferase
MAFEVSAEAYAKFMGRYSRPLATAFADLVAVRAGQRVLDVGCGPGALTEVLVGRVGSELVSAVDPSQSFVDALRSMVPEVQVLRSVAEDLPFGDAAFDATLAQLVVHFMTDPVVGLGEMARVTRPGGTVAANVWDHGGERGPLSSFWRAAKEIDPSVQSEAHLAGVAEGQLLALFEAAEMPNPSATALSVAVVHPSFDEWWDPFTLGVGPAGDHVARLGIGEREQLRQRCRSLLPAPPFTVEAVAWTVWWRKPLR